MLTFSHRGQPRNAGELVLASLLMLPGAAIVPAAIGWVPLHDAMMFAAPLALASLILIVRNRRHLQRPLRGFFAGFAATIGYDSVRWAMSVAGLVKNPFRSIELYGEILAAPSPSAHALGWLFHLWNGCVFGSFYAVAFGKSTWLRAVAWGAFLELALVATSPRLLKLTIQGELLTSSAIGHLVYGMGLHLLLRASARQQPREHGLT